MADEVRTGGRGAGARRGVVGGSVEVRGGWAGLLGMVPVLLLIGGVVLDVFGPVPYAGLPLLSAGPLAACMVLTFRGAVLTAAAACVLAVCVDVLVNRPLTALVVNLLDVAVISAIALWLKWVVQRQGQRFAAVRAVAEVAQRAVLPPPPARVGAVSVATRYECAHAEALIGGDFYAVRNSPSGVRALIGDVRGKGLPAVSTMAVATSAFREAAEQAATLPELAEYMERALARFAADVGDQPDALEQFATAVLVEVSEAEGRVRLHHRGHPPPYLIRGGRVTSLEPSAPGLPLGLGMPEGVGVSGCDTFPFHQGDYLLLVTDGVTEARDRQGTFYEPRTRLADRDFRTASEVVNTLVADVTDWTGGRRHDDMAILALATVR
ncbi:PP2C family protein-serine/threonine phosphatase [Streptomyces asiaticus]